MSSRKQTLLAQVGSFALAGILLYLALRGVELSSVVQALREADYRWLLPFVGVIYLSVFLRAWRWQILLEALPPAGRGAEQRVSVKTSFYSVMIGYMINYAAPRLGEVARSANLATQERLSFSGVFGTVVVERVLDVITLLLGLGVVGLLLLERAGELYDLFLAPAAAWMGEISLLGLGALILAVSVLTLFIFRYALRSERFEGVWTERVRPVLASFKDGLLTLVRTRRWGSLGFITLGMWLCYVLMAYLPFLILGMHRAYELSLLDAFLVMVLGAVGVAIPSPGGTGSYHFITIQTLVHLFEVDSGPAASYAVLSHATLLVLYVAAGALCLLLQGSSLRALQRAAEEGRATQEEVPAGSAVEEPAAAAASPAKNPPEAYPDRARHRR